MTKDRQFYDEHMRYLAAGDIVGLINNTYHEDAILFHNLPYFEGPSPHRHQGREEIINAHLVFMRPDNLGAAQVGEMSNWIEDGDHICFQIPLTIPGDGTWVNTTMWVLLGGMLAREYVLRTRVAD